MFKKKMSTVAVAGLVLALAVMFLGAPTAANAGELQADYFDEATLGDTNWDNTWGAPLTLDTVNERLDWNFRDALGDSDAAWDLSPSTAGTADTNTWTISWDMQFGAWNDLTERQWMVLAFLGNDEQALEIQFKDGSINPRNDLLEEGETVIGYEVDAVLSDLAVDTWIHVDLVFNRSGGELTSYNKGQDLADDGIDLWVDGEIGVSNMINEAAFAAAGLDMLEFFVKGGVDKVGFGIFDNMVVRDEAYVTPVDMVWRTGESDDWAGADWTMDDEATWVAPIADNYMVVNSGTATVSTDVSGTAAGSLEIISLTPATTTATVEIASAGTLAVTGGVNVGDGGTLNVSGLLSAGGLNVDAGGTLELGDGAMIVSPLTAETSPVTITVDGTLRGGGGNSELGDPLSGDWYFTNLALNGGVDCFFDYTFTSPAETDVDAGGTMVAIGDSVNVFGAVEMGDGLTIRLIDGLAGGVSADGVDVALFKVIDGAAIDGVAPDVDGLWTPADLAKITILAPDGADYWTWETLEYVDDEWVVLKGLVTVTPSPTWTATGLGDWNNAANWTTASAPNGNTGAESSVLFGSDITADTTVVTNTPVTVNAITFDSANGYAIAGKGSVTLEDADDAVATVQVAQGTHEFQLPVTLGGNAEVDVVNAGDELIFNNALNLGGFTLEKVGDGLMSVNNVLTLGGGSIEVTEGSLGGSGTVGGSLIVSAAVAPGNSIGTLNVEGDLTLVSASIYEWEVGQGGNADTINISDGTVDLDNFVLMILDADGYVANASVRLPVFTYDPDTTDVNLTGFANDFANFDATGLDETWTVGDLSLTDDEDGLIYLTGLSGGTLIGAVPGDANGDQIVDAADLTLFDVQWGVRGAGLSCDFDNDGDVDADDFAIMRGNWNFGVGGAPLPGIPTPEPATMSLLAIGGLLVLRRRRRER